MNRTLRRVVLVILAFMLVGCNKPAATPVATKQAAGASASPAAPVRLTDWIASAPTIYPELPITEDLPTFAASEQQSFSYPGGPRLPMPQSKILGRVDEQAILSQIAASIDQTGRPDVPADLPAAFAGKLEGDHYVYQLGGLPVEPDGQLAYMLTKQTNTWEATPICRHSWAWVWPGTIQQVKDPVVICAYIEGSGANLHLAAYKAGREVLRVQGLTDSYVQVLADADGGVPTIVAYGSQQWLDHKAEPRVMERYVFTWQDDSYVLSRHERRADWVYHLSRLIGFVAAGTPERAAAEFASPPPEGVRSYVDRQAPDLEKSVAGRLTTAGRFSAAEGVVARAYLRLAGAETGPWFAFDFDKEGLIKEITQEAKAGTPNAPNRPPLNSDEGHLVLRVRSGERGDNHPIAGATVTVAEIGQSFLTDARGLAAFSLPVYVDDERFVDRKPAYYTLSVTLPGFTTETYRDIHAFQGPLDKDHLVDSTVVDVFIVPGEGENVHQIPCLDAAPPPCSGL